MRKVLEAFSGCQFHLSSSGAQMGRDMSSGFQNRLTVAVECKRYGQDTEFDRRELLGELVQSCNSIPDLDLWVLVASRSLPDQIFHELAEEAYGRQVGFIDITAGTSGRLGTLEALLAHEASAVLSHFQQTGHTDESENVQAALEAWSSSLDFHTATATLVAAFEPSELGYEGFRMAQQEWFVRCLRSAEDARAAFGQDLRLQDASRADPIHREAALSELDNWFSGWAQSPELFALLGEEGNGKTWAAASWAKSRIEGPGDFPPVIFVSAATAEANLALGLLTGAIVSGLGERRPGYWEKGLQRWTERRTGMPVAVLILDGVNERRPPDWWRSLLEDLLSTTWRDSLAVIVTCRSSYWREHFSRLRSLTCHEWALGAFSQDELDQALHQHELTRADFPPDLLPLLSKPRYFDLAVSHRQRLSQSGDFTVARLFYEDWRDRRERKTGIPLSDQQFQNFIVDIARRLQQGETQFRESDLVRSLPVVPDHRPTLDELISGGVFDSAGGQFCVNADHLPLGFGLYLAQEVESAIDRGESPSETIAQAIEAQRQWDLTAQICEFAALHALSRSGFPLAGQIQLLRAWLSSMNLRPGSESTFTDYFPVCPQAYLEFCEVLWSDDHENRWGQELMMEALLKWNAIPSVAAALPIYFGRWLGFVHRDGSPLLRTRDGARDDEVSQSISARMGGRTQLGGFEIAGFQLTLINDDGLLRLGRTSLAVISHIPREPFALALATGVLAESVAGLPEKGDLFEWVIRSSRDDLSPELFCHAERLGQFGETLTSMAAYRLLSYIGTSAALERRSQLPADLFPPHPWRQRHQEDPCISGMAWDRADCDRCIPRSDLDAVWVARRIKPFCPDPGLSAPDATVERLRSLPSRLSPEEIWSQAWMGEMEHLFEEVEPALCRFAPESIADFLRTAANRAACRNPQGLRFLAFELGEHPLVLGDAEVAALSTTWEQYESEASGVAEDDRLLEPFLFKLILSHRSVEEQLELLLGRPTEALDLLALQEHFKPIQDWTRMESVLRTASDPVSLRRALWFAAGSGDRLPSELIPDLLRLSAEEDSGVRGRALALLYECAGPEGARALLAQGWEWNRTARYDENHFGSLLLADHATDVSYADLRPRIHPCYFGIALSRRGYQPAEVQLYSEDLDRVWRGLGATRDLPDDFPESELHVSGYPATPGIHLIGLSDRHFSQSVTYVSRAAFWGGLLDDLTGDPSDIFSLPAEQEDDRQQLMQRIMVGAIDEQREVGNTWFSEYFYPEGLAVVIAARPDLLDKWLSEAEAPDRGTRRLLLGRRFYESLCEVLFTSRPRDAARLYWRLWDTPGGVGTVIEGLKIPTLECALFAAPDSQPVREIWGRRLSLCISDSEILDLILAARQGGDNAWLWEAIEGRLVSSVAIDRALAITLLGLMGSDSGRAAALLEESRQCESGGWVAAVAQSAHERRDRDSYARHWYGQFLSETEPDKAWAAFRLFLQCVDRRFWLWKRAEEQAALVQDADTRFRLVAGASQDIKKATKRNEEALRKCFLSRKILDRQAWPWMSQYAHDGS
ncbi:MAG: NACHT domain-containing protein [Armatimonadetes bacterium]|nr:NACHT domain-containing protein [Armatimonadota bacterium]